MWSGVVTPSVSGQAWPPQGENATDIDTEKFPQVLYAPPPLPPSLQLSQCLY